MIRLAPRPASILQAGKPIYSGEDMKAISLYQPWATLMALNLKKNETREWWTSHRGALLIHAAKKIIPCPSEYIWEVLQSNGLEMKTLPRGFLLCQVNLKACVPTINFRSSIIDAPEYEFGNYDIGRYAWITDSLKTFDPIPFKGKQRFFEVPDELLREAVR